MNPAVKGVPVVLSMEQLTGVWNGTVVSQPLVIVNIVIGGGVAVDIKNVTKESVRIRINTFGYTFGKEQLSFIAVNNMSLIIMHNLFFVAPMCSKVHGDFRF